MKKNLLTVLIMALVIVNIVLTSVMMVSVMSTNRKTADLVTNIATAMNLELNLPGEEEKEKVSLENTDVYAISDALTIPLKGDGSKTVYIVFNIAFSMNTKHKDYKTYGETMADRESLVKDVIETVVMAHTENECRNDIEGLKEEILKGIQNLFQSDFIYNVAINGVKFGS